MNISIKTSELMKACRSADRCLNRRHPIAALTHLLLTLSPKLLEITATDLDSAVRVPIEVDFTGEAQVTVLGHTFIRTIQSLADEYIGIDISSTGKLLVKRECGDIKILTGNARDYPNAQFNGPDNYKFKFKRTEMIAALRLSGFALEDGQTELASQIFRQMARLSVTTNLIESKFEIMSTNEQILSFVNGLCWKKEGESDGDISIPKTAIRQLLGILADSTDDDVFMSESDNQIYLNIGDIAYSFRKAAVRFPDMSKAKTVEYPHSITIDASMVRSALKRMHILCDERKRSCLFTIDDSVLTISTQSGDKGEIQESFDIKQTGESLSVLYNLDYLTDIFSRTEGEVALHFAPSSGSFALKVHTETDEVQADMVVQGLRDFAGVAAAA